MKQKKNLLFVFFLWGCAFVAVQAQNMYVLENNTTLTPYTIDNIKSLTFTPGNVIVNETYGNTSSYALSDIRYINFDMTILVENHGQNAYNFSLFPNPVNDYLNINYRSNYNETMQLVIYDMQGREVYKETISINTEGLKVNISNLYKGMYLCRLHNGQNSITKKFIKN